MHRAWLLLLTACEPLGPIRAGADGDALQQALVVTPASLDFGALSVREDGSRNLRFTVTNGGDEEITVYDHDEVPTSTTTISADATSTDISTSISTNAIFTVDAPPLFQLAPGESREITVTFAPQTSALYSGRISINDGVEEIELRGVGLAPVVSLTAEEPSALALGCSEDFLVRIANTGEETLELAGAQLAGGGDFTLLDDPPSSLEPGEQAALNVRFEPRYDPHMVPDREDWLLVESNDPATPTATLDLSVLAFSGSQVNESFIYHPGLAVDLLLAVDTRGVMEAHLQKAEDAFYTLADSISEANLQVNAAIVTGASTCPATQPVFLESDASSADLLGHLASGLYGPDGSGSDRLLLHAADALDKDAPGGCLEGFTRPGALLHVLLLAGSADESGWSAEDQVTLLHERAPLAAGHLVSAIVATDEDGCQGATYGAGYADAAVLTDGEIGDLCASAWDDTFAAVVERSTPYASGGMTHALERTPLPESLSVKVDDVTYEGWQYDDANNSLLFPAEGAPSTGSSVSLSYVEAVDCDKE